MNHKHTCFLIYLRCHASVAFHSKIETYYLVLGKIYFLKLKFLHISVFFEVVVTAHYTEAFFLANSATKKFYSLFFGLRTTVT